MPVSVLDKIAALLASLAPDDVNALSPVERRRFADLCRHWAAIAERPSVMPPKAGVLLDLRNGTPRHE